MTFRVNVWYCWSEWSRSNHQSILFFRSFPSTPNTSDVGFTVGMGHGCGLRQEGYQHQNAFYEGHMQNSYRTTIHLQQGLLRATDDFSIEQAMHSTRRFAELVTHTKVVWIQSVVSNINACIRIHHFLLLQDRSVWNSAIPRALYHVLPESKFWSKVSDISDSSQVYLPSEPGRRRVHEWARNTKSKTFIAASWDIKLTSWLTRLVNAVCFRKSRLLRFERIGLSTSSFLSRTCCIDNGIVIWQLVCANVKAVVHITKLSCVLGSEICWCLYYPNLERFMDNEWCFCLKVDASNFQAPLLPNFDKVYKATPGKRQLQES